MHPRAGAVDADGAVDSSSVLDAGEPLAQQVEARRQEQVQVPALRHAPARRDGSAGRRSRSSTTTDSAWSASARAASSPAMLPPTTTTRPARPAVMVHLISPMA